MNICRKLSLQAYSCRGSSNNIHFLYIKHLLSEKTVLFLRKTLNQRCIAKNKMPINVHRSDKCLENPAFLRKLCYTGDIQLKCSCLTTLVNQLLCKHVDMNFRFREICYWYLGHTSNLLYSSHNILWNTEVKIRGPQTEFTENSKLQF